MPCGYCYEHRYSLTMVRVRERQVLVGFNWVLCRKDQIVLHFKGLLLYSNSGDGSVRGKESGRLAQMHHLISRDSIGHFHDPPLHMLSSKLSSGY